MFLCFSVSIEKNRAEADRLRKLHMKLAAESQARMLNMGPAAAENQLQLVPFRLGTVRLQQLSPRLEIWNIILY